METDPPAPLSNVEILRRLAVSESGFVFDPVSGNSYTVNGTGLAILRLIQGGLSSGEIVDALQKQFAVDAMTAEQEVVTFTLELRGHFR